MKSQDRFPSKSSVLEQINDFGTPVSSVIDIGIYLETPELMEAYPNQKHYLFEPVSDHYETIEKNYENAGIDYDLLKLAVSNEDGFAELSTSSINDTDAVTHSSLEISRTPGTALRRVEMVTLDTFVKKTNPAAPYLIKIDVDGLETLIMQGAKEAFKGCSVLIVEAHVSQIAQRMEIAVEAGFILIDIVDFCYNRGCLWQADLVFINPKFAPDGFKTGTSVVDMSDWFGFDERVKKIQPAASDSVQMATEKPATNPAESSGEPKLKKPFFERKIGKLRKRLSGC